MFFSLLFLKMTSSSSLPVILILRPAHTSYNCRKKNLLGIDQSEDSLTCSATNDTPGRVVTLHIQPSPTAS